MQLAVAGAGKSWLSNLLSRSSRTRLTDSPDFERVYRQGQACRGKVLSVHAFPNEMGVARLGMSVSKKVGNAVTRNTIRRRLKEVFRATSPELLGERDIVVSARPAAAAADYDAVRAEFGQCIEKLNNSQLAGKA